MTTWDKIGEGTVAAAIVAAIVGLFSLVVWSTVGVVRSNGETDYCYVEMWSPGNMAPQYQLHAHRPWRLDIILGNYPTLDEAASKAEMLRCPLGKR